MEEQLIEIEFNTNDVSSNNVPTIWDIENSEKIQFINFIEQKMEEKYSKKFDYYEQLLLSQQKEYTNQISALVGELDYMLRVSGEMEERINDLQNNNKNKMIYIPFQHNDEKLPNYVGNGRYRTNGPYEDRRGMLVYDKYDTTTVYCDKFYPQLCELPNLTELKLDDCMVYGTFYEEHFIKLISVKKLEITYTKRDIFTGYGKDAYCNYCKYPVKCTYEDTMKMYVLNIFPNLEHLIINLKIVRLQNYPETVSNETIVAQALVKLIEYHPCNINKITIKNRNYPGNLELLKTYASNNGIEFVQECLINK